MKKSKNKNGKILKFFQKISRAFLVPMAIIAASALLVGISSIMKNTTINQWLPFLGSAPIRYVADLAGSIGSITMNYLPVIYAITLAFSLADEDKEFAAFAGFIGYLSFLTSMGIVIKSFPTISEMYPAQGIQTVLGVETVNVGILGGIVVGIITAALHNRFRTVHFPMAFAFFQGVRFVPFMSACVMMLFGQFVPVIWAPITEMINAFANLVNQAGAFGPFLYGSVEKLLIPTGLHQIWNTIIRDTQVSGIYEFASGVMIEGSRPAFFQYAIEGLPKDAELTEMVKFLRAGQMPFTIFVAPAIALAIYHCADKEKRSLIKPLVMTGAITAVVAGITEPLEFIFLFTAPLLFVIYALIGGLNWMILYLLGNTMGGTDANLIGLTIWGFLRPEANWWWTVLLGVIEAPLMYGLFRWWIIKFDVKTPGRGGDYDESLEFAAEIANVNTNSGKDQKAVTDPKILKARMIIEGLGGKDNIVEVDSCMSRLRVEYKDAGKIKEDILKKTGCAGIVKPDEQNIHIIYGTTAGMIKNAINKELKNMK